MDHYYLPGHSQHCYYIIYPPHAGGNPVVTFICQCCPSYQPNEQCSTGSLACTQPQPNSPTPSSPIHSTITPSVTTTRNRSQCHICPDSFPRWQDRDRHELKHLPYFMHCPLPHCPWRGNRPELFKKHWHQENHRPFHGQYGDGPEGNQIETYDPWVILEKIRSGAISPCEGEDDAIILVQVKAYELQKTSVWTDPWGRKKK